MHESEFSNGLVSHMRENLGGSIVFKHSDQLTGGIPDTSVTWRSRTTWLEIKVDRKGAIRKRDLQATNMKRLAASGKNAFYVTFGVYGTKITHPVSGEILVESGIPKDYRMVEMFIRQRHAS